MTKQKSGFGIFADLNVHVITSVAVAEQFNKTHDEILTAIEMLECDDEFRFENYGILNDRYVMTEAGHLLLAMGLDGKEACRFKEQLITENSEIGARVIDKIFPGLFGSGE